ncbi:ATPase [Clostridium rectalis]|uniref:ATPase n=1 Tax=Clostridium rectalis TaxID=2040295 RepID=UPI000F630989|nr:ATPase [Clostridium rectalis]
MDVMKLLEYLQDIIETSSKVPMTGKVMIDRKEVLEVIDKIINYLPPEFKKAQWVFEEKDRIIEEAVKEAEVVKKENLSLLKRQIESHDITKEATNKAEEILILAKKDAKLIRRGAREYADEILSQLEIEIKEKSQEMLTNLHKEMESYLSSIDSEVNSATNTIKENINELRKMNR